MMDMKKIIEEVVIPENVEAYDPFALISMIAERFNYVCIDRFSHEYLYINEEGEFEEPEDINPFINDVFKNGFRQKLKMRKIKCEK